MNQTTANYDEPWKEALSHLENGFLEETRFLCVRQLSIPSKNQN
jgi:hypothetical protein